MHIILFVGGSFLLLALILIVFSGCCVVRPTERGLVERLGKYHSFASPGFNWIIPGIDRMVVVNVTECMVTAEPQEIITDDNLNAIVDAQIYFKIKADEQDVKNSQYNVNDVDAQIVALARTTLRNIIGTMSLKDANSKRGQINTALYTDLNKETSSWGIDIVRTELKEIEPPKDVQATMNMVVKAANEKLAAVDFATAKETEADGFKRGEIKRAEGIKQAAILEAEGKAKAIELVNEAAQKHFTGDAIELRRLEVVENAFKNATKIIIPTGMPLVNVLGDIVGKP